jgi:hypothetical protein
MLDRPLGRSVCIPSYLSISFLFPQGKKRYIILVLPREILVCIHSYISLPPSTILRSSVQLKHCCYYFKIFNWRSSFVPPSLWGGFNTTVPLGRIQHKDQCPMQITCHRRLTTTWRVGTLIYSNPNEYWPRNEQTNFAAYIVLRNKNILQPEAGCEITCPKSLTIMAEK